jgi:r1t holin
MVSRRRTRLTVLAAHIAASGLWLGVLTATAITPGPRLVYVLGPAAVVTTTTGLWLARGLWRFGWVRVKAALSVGVVATASVIHLTHLTGQVAAGARYAAVTALLAATVVAVVKPHRTAHHQPAPMKENPVGTYALRVLDRAARTALQVFAGYLVAAHTIGGVDWRTAILAAALTIAVALLQGLVDLPAITGIGVAGDILGRAIRTAAQVTLGSVGANVLLITDIPWSTVLSAAGLAALTSIITSLAALLVGPPSVQGTPEVFGPSNATVTRVAA